MNILYLEIPQRVHLAFGIPAVSVATHSFHQQSEGFARQNTNQQRLPLPVPRLSSYIIVDGEQPRASAIALSVYLSRL